MILFAVNSGLTDDLPLERCADFEEQLLSYLGSIHPEIGQSIADSGNLPENVSADLTKAITDFKATFS